MDSFSWTPGGTRIVFDYACGIYSINCDGSSQQQLVGAWPASGYCVNDAPHVNPVDGRIAWLNWNHGIAVADRDGRWIAFLRGYGNLYKIRPDGTGLTQLTFYADPDAVIDSGSWAWTADSNWLVVPAQVASRVLHGRREVHGLVTCLVAVATDGSGQTLPINTLAGQDPDHVGAVGTVVVEIQYLFLPSVLR